MSDNAFVALCVVGGALLAIAFLVLSSMWMAHRDSRAEREYLGEDDLTSLPVEVAWVSQLRSADEEMDELLEVPSRPTRKGRHSGGRHLHHHDDLETGHLPEEAPTVVLAPPGLPTRVLTIGQHLPAEPPPPADQAPVVPDPAEGFALSPRLQERLVRTAPIQVPTWVQADFVLAPQVYDDRHPITRLWDWEMAKMETDKWRDPWKVRA